MATRTAMTNTNRNKDTQKVSFSVNTKEIPTLKNNTAVRQNNASLVTRQPNSNILKQTKIPVLKKTTPSSNVQQSNTKGTTYSSNTANKDEKVSSTEQFNISKSKALSELDVTTKAAFQDYYDSVTDTNMTITPQYAKDAVFSAMKKQGLEATEDNFGKYYEYFKYDADERRASQKKQETEKKYDDASTLGRIGMNAKTVAKSAIGGISALSGIINDILPNYDNNAPINTNSTAFDVVNNTDTVRGKTSENIHKSLGDGVAGNVANAGYGALMSLGDMATTLPFGEAVSLANGAINAGVRSTKEATERGADKKKAVTTGAVSGAIEVLTEKIGLDNLVGMIGKNGADSVIKQTLKQSGIEATEEMISEVLNTVSDYAINKNDSAFVQDDKTVKDVAKDTLYAGIGGAIGGGLSAGAISGANKILDMKQSQQIPTLKQQSGVEKEINLTEVSNANANENQFSTVTGPVPAVSTDSPSLSNNTVPVLKKPVNNMGEGGIASEDLWNELSQGNTKSQQSTQQIPVLREFNQQTTDTQQTASKQRKPVYAEDYTQMRYTADNDYAKILKRKVSQYGHTYGKGITNVDAAIDIVRNSIDEYYSNPSKETFDAMYNYVTQFDNILQGTKKHDGRFNTDVPWDAQLTSYFKDIKDQYYKSAADTIDVDPDEKIMKTTETATNTFRNSKMYADSPTFAQIVEDEINTGGVQFESISHEKAYKRAGQEVDADYVGQYKKLMSDERWVNTSVDVAKAHLITQKLINDGNFSSAEALMWRTAKAGHEAGQELEAFKTFAKTPEGVVQNAYNYMFKQTEQWKTDNKVEYKKLQNTAEILDNSFSGLSEYQEILDGVNAYLKQNKLEKKFGGAADQIAQKISQGANVDDITDFLARYEAVGIDLIDAETYDYVIKETAKAQALGDSKEASKIMNNVYATLADKIATTDGFEKFNAWKYMAMLSSPTTHIANMAGNTANYMVHSMSRNLQGMIEPVIAKMSGGTMERQASVLNPLSNQDRVLQRACADYIENKAYSLFKDSRMSVKGGIESNKSIYNNKVLEGIRNFESNTLDAEDWLFLKLNGKKYLASYMKANGMGVDAMSDASKMRDAVNYAIKKSKEATYHEQSLLANTLTGLKKSLQDKGVGGKIGATAIDAISPFTRMSANYVKEGVRYSPLELAKATGESIQLACGKGNKLGADVLDDWCKGLTGTGILSIGLLLGALGIVHGHDTDEEQQEFDELQGKQAYAIDIDLTQFGGKKYTYTIDGILGSAGLSLLAGANLAKLMNGEGIDLNDALTTIGSLGNPLVEQSFVNSFNQLLSSVKSADDGKEFTALATQIGVNAVTQQIPTIMRRVANAVNGESKTTYTGLTGGANTAAKLGYKIINSIPGAGTLANKAGEQMQQSQIPMLQKAGEYLSNANQPYLNAWGENQEVPGNNIGTRLAYQLGSKGYLAEVNTSDIEAMLQDIHDNAIGEVDVFPQVPSSKVKIDGSYRKLTPSEYTDYQHTIGEYEKDILGYFANSEYRNELSADEAGSLVETVYNAAMYFTQHDMFDTGLNGRNEKLYDMYQNEGIDKVTDYLSFLTIADGLGVSASDSNYEKWQIGGREALEGYKYDCEAFKSAGYESVPSNEDGRDWTVYKNGGVEALKEFKQDKDFFKSIGYKSTPDEDSRDWKVYKERGADALQTYNSIKQAATYTNEKGNKTTDAFIAYIEIVSNDSFSDEDKGYYLKQFAATDDSTKLKLAIIEDEVGLDGIATYYSMKYHADSNGKGGVSAVEARDYLLKMGYRGGEASYWFELLAPSNAKNPFGTPTIPVKWWLQN